MVEYSVAFRWNASRLRPSVNSGELWTMDGGTKRQRDFAKYYVEHLSPSKAYRLAYDHEHCPADYLHARAQEVLNTPIVQQLIADRKAEVAELYKTDVTSVLRDWIKLAQADPNELVEHRVECCRHCHGVEFGYQWIDADEWALAAAVAMQKDGAHVPTDDGGVGFDPRVAPHPDCPRCQGDGNVRVIGKDTRKLTGAGRMLYAGVKMTKHGPEIVMHDQARARENIAKHFGMFIDKVELGGPGGGPIPTADITPTDPIEAAKLYQRIMGTGA